MRCLVLKPVIAVLMICACSVASIAMDRIVSEVGPHEAATLGIGVRTEQNKCGFSRGVYRVTVSVPPTAKGAWVVLFAKRLSQLPKPVPRDQVLFDFRVPLGSETARRSEFSFCVKSEMIDNVLVQITTRSETVDLAPLSEWK